MPRKINLQISNAGNQKSVYHIINIQVRLQNQSENTKLLKIQQKQREIESEYQMKKKDMHETLAKLSSEAQLFLKQQDASTQYFDNQKQQIFLNDHKKLLYSKQQKAIKDSNDDKRRKIQQKKINLQKITLELENLKIQINDYRIYFDFLKQLQGLSEEYNVSQDNDQSVMHIIQQYETLEKKRSELIQQHKRVQNQKDRKVKLIQQLKNQNQDKILTYHSRIKDLKAKIDQLSEQNVNLESEIEGKLNQNNEKLTEIGQIIFSIRSLYSAIVGEDKPYKNISDMLSVINEEKKRLKNIMESYQKLEEKKK